jgi:hypothetical protein
MERLQPALARQGGVARRGKTWLVLGNHYISLVWCESRKLTVRHFNCLRVGIVHHAHTWGTAIALKHWGEGE